jgi:GcrA cell cycle regulator
MAWTSAKDKLIRERWAEGLSAKTIAAEIGGVTRNDVLKRLHQLGLGPKSQDTSTTRTKGSRTIDDVRLEKQVVGLLKENKFKIFPGNRDDLRAEHFVAQHFLFGRNRRCAVQVVSRADNAKALAYWEQFSPQKIFRRFDEAWLVTDEFIEPLNRVDRLHGQIFHVLDLPTIKGLLAQLRRSPVRKLAAGARTKVGKAIQANQNVLDLALASLAIQIDDKLQSLRNARPNSEDAIANMQDQISQYEGMSSQVGRIRDAIDAFSNDRSNETKVVESVNTFADGIKSWWNKSHATICARAFDLGLFASSVAICSMAGAGGRVAAVVSAVLVSGKSVSSVLNRITKSFSAD